jgi:hypothetical protein
VLEHDVAVMLEAEGRQRVDDALRGTWGLPGRIDIFDAQEPAAVMSKRIQATGQGRDERTGMQRAGAGQGAKRPT